MTSRRPIILTAAAVAAAAAIAGGCGDSHDEHSGAEQVTTSMEHGTGGAAGPDHAAMGHEAAGAPPEAKVGTIDGLKSSADGYTLKGQTASLGTGGGLVRFRIAGRDGKPVTKFGVDQTKRMHLIVASRDLIDYEHVHPVMAANGTWSVKVGLPTSTGYRVFADFVAGGERHVLGWNLRVGRQSTSRALPPPRPRAATDGFDVAIAAPMLEPGKEAKVTFTVNRSGAGVRDLQPYLGALGHLVMLRQGDLEYLHVHPVTGPDAGGPQISFMVDLPRPGTYRAFLQFQQGGKVRTAAYTVAATP